MSFRKLFLVALAVFVSLVVAAPSVFANEHEKACKADADCEHGEHCKDGHCHK